MPTLSIFTGESLSEAHAHQIRSFIRMHWHDEYQYSLEMDRWFRWSGTRRTL